jgi:predicted DNA-binding protein
MPFLSPVSFVSWFPDFMGTQGRFFLFEVQTRTRELPTPPLDSPRRDRIRFGMTKILTLRLDPVLLEKAEARAARLGVDRAKYVRSLIEEDLASSAEKAGSAFASADLAGIYEGDGEAATNQETRERMKRRR